MAIGGLGAIVFVCGRSAISQPARKRPGTRRPLPYEAIRLSNAQFGNAVYVEYTKTGKRECHNIDKAPFERHNTYNRLSPSQRKQLHRILIGLERCHNAASCWSAAEPQG